MIVLSNPTRGILSTSFPLDVRRQCPMAADSLTPPRYSSAALRLASRAARISFALFGAGGSRFPWEMSNSSKCASFERFPGMLLRGGLVGRATSIWDEASTIVCLQNAFEDSLGNDPLLPDFTHH